MYCVTAIHSPYLIPVLSIRTILVYQNIARPHSVFGTKTNNCLVCFALSPRATWRHELQTLGSTCQVPLVRTFWKIWASLAPFYSAKQQQQTAVKTAKRMDWSQSLPKGEC